MGRHNRRLCGLSNRRRQSGEQSVSGQPVHCCGGVRTGVCVARTGAPYRGAAIGAQAHFVANVQMLAISIVVAFLPLGLFFAAPGAVWHRGYLTPRQSGLIALAGPATNMALAVIFLIAAPFAFLVGLRDTWIVGLFYTGVALNAWLGLFNMIPAGPFDGAKVLAWSPVVFGVTVGIGILLAFVLPGNLLPIWLSVLRLLGS